MTSPPRVYVPPSFDLYEFDDDAPSAAAAPARRWFRNWNGLIGAPAEGVTLGWSAGDATVLVGTRGELQHEEWARLEAAYLALSGADVPLPARPPTPGPVHREAKRIMSSTDLWSPIPALFTGGPAAQAAVLDGFLIAYCMLRSGAVVIAAFGVGTDRLSIRRVRDWRAYDQDATTSFPLSDLKGN